MSAVAFTELKKMLISNLELIELALNDSKEGIEAFTLERTQPHSAIDPPTASPPTLDACKNVVAACGMLTALLRNPFVGIITSSSSHLSNCFNTVVEGDVATVIAKLDNPKGSSAAEIAEKVGPKTDALRLERVLRLMAAQHFFTEVSPGRFSNNRATFPLVNDPAISSFLLHHTDETSFASLGLAQLVLGRPSKFECFVQQWKKGEAYTKPLGSSEKIESGLDALSGGKVSFWEVQPERLTRFNEGMQIGERSVGVIQASAFGWTQYPKLMDVGGGTGGFARSLLKLHQGIQVSVFDLPAAAKEGNEKAENKELIESGKLKFEGGSFFDSLPAQPGDFNAVVMRHILHDWADKEALDILATVRRSMNKETRLFVLEQVLTTVETTKEGEEGMKWPLPKNGGVAGLFPYVLDLQMLTLAGSLERTIGQWTELFEKAKFKLVKDHRLPADVHILEVAIDE